MTSVSQSVEASIVRADPDRDANREPVELPAALRSFVIQLMGSGLKSVPLPKLLDAIRHTFDLAAAGKLQVDAKTVALAQVNETWDSPGRPRLVYTI